MKKTLTRFLLCILAISLALPGSAQQANPTAPTAPANSPEELQPKFFIWGLVLNIAFKFAMNAFNNWLANKASTDVSDPNSMKKILLNSASTVVTSLSSATPFGAKSAGGPENTVIGEPNKPLTIENGKENFQAVHVAIVGFNASGMPTNIQPVTANFRTGDRFKLKVIPTFDGLLVIENINPKSERSQIYPANATEVVSAKAGVEIFVPLAIDEFFQFAGNTGDEQLLITVRDPRAFGESASKAPANRKDEASGSSFVQETPPNTYPVISQSLQLKHIAK